MNDAPRGSPPRVSELRLLGASPDKIRIEPPLGASFRDSASALAIVLRAEQARDAASVAEALPAPESLSPGTVLIVLSEILPPPSLTSRMLAAIGRAPAVPRALLCSALVARGYVGVGAGLGGGAKGRGGREIAWAYAPDPATGPC